LGLSDAILQNEYMQLPHTYEMPIIGEEAVTASHEGARYL
jgi:hypothetical protein